MSWRKQNQGRCVIAITGEPHRPAKASALGPRAEVMVFTFSRGPHAKRNWIVRWRHWFRNELGKHHAAALGPLFTALDSAAEERLVPCYQARRFVD